MKNKTTRILLSLFTFLFLATPAFAAETSGKPSVAQAILKSMPPQAQVYLTASKLQSCLAREAAIQTRSTSLSRMANNMLEKFDSIVSRVQDYYEKSGKTVARYSVLVTEVQTKRDAVQTALNAATNDVSGFSCTSNDPKGHMSSFQKDMKLVKSALKDYRTAIKNLIVAVRSSTATEVKEKESESPKPSPSASSEAKRTPNPRSNSQGRGNNQ